MHNRDLIWSTNDGRDVKIKDMSTKHLCNTLQMIKLNVVKYNRIYGEYKISIYIDNMEQEIRLRKLNRLKNNNENDELF